MSVWAKRAALIFLSGLAGCLTTTSDRSGDRALGQACGFWRCERLAAQRVALSPAAVAAAVASPFGCAEFSRGRACFLSLPMAIWGLGEMAEELGVGLVEMMCASQFSSCAYPMERFKLDVEDWHRTAEPTAVPAAALPTVEPENAVDRAIRERCERGDWTGAAKICRLHMSKSADDLKLILNATRLAMVNWNAGDRIGAVIAMDTVVTVCRAIGGECVTRATAFRGELREGRAPTAFPVAEVMDLTGIRRAIYEAARDASRLRRPFH